MFEYLFRWETLWYLMLLLYVPSCAGLIIIVLLQKGKGVGFAGAFGVGAGSDAVFGPRASKSLPQRLTYIMAAIFMVLALGMSLISGRLGKGAAPEKLSDQTAPAPTTPATDLGVLDDLGSAYKESPPVTATPAPGGTETPATPPAAAAETPAAPVAPAAAETPATPPAPASEAPAPEVPATPAPATQ